VLGEDGMGSGHGVDGTDHANLTEPAGAPPAPERTLLICCGAVAREVVAIVRANGWDHVRVQCLPPEWHNHPERIPEGVRAQIVENRGRFHRVLVLYSDCGTGGRLQRVLDEEGVEGIGGAHCYEVFTGADFHDLMREEPGTFFLTDFLARNFRRLVFVGLGLDRHPRLRDLYFGRYRRVVYLAQTDDPKRQAEAEAAARSIGLELEVRRTGLGKYEPFLRDRVVGPAGDPGED
jgi:hypothetical protein